MQIKQVMFEKVGLSSKMFAFSSGILDNSSLKDVSPGRQLGAYCMYGDLQKKRKRKKEDTTPTQTNKPQTWPNVTST